MSGFKFCPYCKEILRLDDYVYKCVKGHLVYLNPAPCVTVIPVKDNEATRPYGHKILISKRAIEPKKGALDLIGGFVKVGETTEEAAIRETFEETGLTVKIKNYLGQYTEMDYAPGITYPLCSIYIVEIISGNIKPQDDVSELFWVDINKVLELDFTGSFETIKPTLEKFLNLYSRGAEN